MTKRYKFSVGPGNNSELVRRTFLRRPWWDEVPVEDDSFDCHWRQVRSRELAEKVKKNGNRQLLNHHQGLNCLCRKSELYRNLKAYFISQSRNVHDIVPQTYIITVGEYGTDMTEFTKHCKMLESKQRAGSPQKAGSTTSESDALSAASTVLTPSKAVAGKQSQQISPAVASRARPQGAVRQPLVYGSSTINRNSKATSQTARRGNADVVGEIVSMSQPFSLNDDDDVPAGYTSEQESGKRGQTPPRGMRASASPPKLRGKADFTLKAERPPLNKSRAPPSSSSSRTTTVRDARSTRTAGTLSSNSSSLSSTSVTTSNSSSAPQQESTLPKARGVSVPAWGVGKNTKNPKLTEQEKKKLSLSKWNPASDWSEKQESNNMWIVKPTNSNRGNGIQVFSDLRAIEANLQKRGNGYTAIVQKYIERPLLIHERKFDIRQLVFVDNNMRVYRYNRPYIRTSSTAYDTSNLEDRFVHLTNYSVQKYSDACNAHEEGNNMNMQQFQQYIDQFHASAGISVEQHIITRIESIIADTMRAVQNKLNPFRDPNSFELYGYDFLIDEDFKVWLLEVNTNPYIGFSSTMLSEIFTGMMEGMFRIVVDTMFPPPPSAQPLEEVAGADGWKLLSLDRKPSRPANGNGNAAVAATANVAAVTTAITTTTTTTGTTHAPAMNSAAAAAAPNAAVSAVATPPLSTSAARSAAVTSPPPAISNEETAATASREESTAPVEEAPAPSSKYTHDIAATCASPLPEHVTEETYEASPQMHHDDSKLDQDMDQPVEEDIYEEPSDDGDLEYGTCKPGEVQDLIDMAA